MESGSRRRARTDEWNERSWGGEARRARIERPQLRPQQPPQPQPQQPQFRIRKYFDPCKAFDATQKSAAPFLPLGHLDTEAEYFLYGLFDIPKINTLRNLYGIDRPYFIPANETPDEKQRRLKANEHIQAHVPPYFAQLQARLISHLIVLTRMRLSFKHLANRFLIRTIERQPLPQMDAITLEPIEQPLIVYDMQHRCRHCFEARPLMIHIHNQLLYSAGGFNSSQLPRNPLTNLPFQLSQLTSIVTQLKKYGHVTWPILAFAATNFALPKFKILHEPALRYTAIMNYIYVEPPQYVAEELVDFIIVYANIHKSPIYITDINMLTHAATHYSSDPYLMCWRRLYRVALFYNLISTAPSSYDTPDMLIQRKTIMNLSRILLLNMGQYVRECRQKHKQAVDSYAQQQMHILEAIMNIFEDGDADDADDEAVYDVDETDGEDSN